MMKIFSNIELIEKYQPQNVLNDIKEHFIMNKSKLFDLFSKSSCPISKYKVSNFIFKEHPLNLHYNGEEDKRDWLYKIEGEYLSFFKYWNKIRKKLI